LFFIGHGRSMVLPGRFFRAGKALGAVFNQLVRSCVQLLFLGSCLFQVNVPENRKPGD
jgi:hypothetical protein